MPVPCHGPTCSQHHSDPLPVPVSRPTTNLDDSASLLPVPILNDGERIDQLMLSDPCPTHRLLSSVFRPPRAGSH
jgi:hypothetical protein